jgi:pyruvate,orthophosphate dikinase
VKKTVKGKAPKAAKKYVYAFASGKAEGDRTMKDILGCKGSGLAEMTNAGLPVPPGFTISTAACNLWYAEGRKLPQAIEDDDGARASWSRWPARRLTANQGSSPCAAARSSRCPG